MIDLRTDDGLGEALRAVASWPGPDAATADGVQVRPIATAPAPIPIAPQRRRQVAWLAAAAVLVLALIAGLLAQTGSRVPTADGTWQSMAASPLSARFAPVSLWIGDRLLVWGGHDVDGNELHDGATYDPATDRWTSIAEQPFPYERRSGVGVGQEGGSATYPTPGAWFEGQAYFVLASPDEAWGWDLVAYDPVTDEWKQVDRARFDQQPNDSLVMHEGTATVQSPVALVVHDGELLVFGWHSLRSEYGWASFDPTTTAWGDFTGVPGSNDEYGFNWATPGTPILMEDRYLVWVTSQGLNSNPRSGFSVDLDTGKTIDIEAPVDVEIFWLSGLSSDGVTVGASTHGGLHDGHRFSAQLDPSTGRWAPVSALHSGPAEAADDEGAPMVVAAGEATVVVGGLERSYVVGGLKSTPGDQILEDERWHRLPDAPIDLDRTGFVAVWTGTDVLVWGGATTPDGDHPSATVPLADGARYRVR